MKFTKNWKQGQKKILRNKQNSLPYTQIESQPEKEKEKERDPHKEPVTRAAKRKREQQEQVRTTEKK